MLTGGTLTVTITPSTPDIGTNRSLINSLGTPDLGAQEESVRVNTDRIPESSQVFMVQLDAAEKFYRLRGLEPRDLAEFNRLQGLETNCRAEFNRLQGLETRE